MKIYFSRHARRQMKWREVAEDEKVIGLEIIGATERYKLEDIFNLSTENLILEETAQKR
jgi:hypothetical protein